jgi:pyruvate dehydrogenase E2 component (dihydrolipoamide acetyltransferase)
VAPAIHDADRRSVDEVMAALGDLIARTRAGTIRSSELADPTITVTSLGDLGVDSVLGVVNPPQVALVGFGRIADQPWAEGGTVGIRRVVTATLSADHRVSDGHRGGLFLSAVDRRLSDPESL